MTLHSELFERLRLYAIYSPVDDAGRETDLAPTDWLDRVLAAGFGTVQIRDKHQRLADNLVRLFVRRCEQANAMLILNDDLQRAQDLGVHGVHVGQSDAPVASARAVSKDWIVGYSSADGARAEQALLDGADYIGIGPIHATDSKNTGRQPLGWSGFDAVATQTLLPAVAIGGLGPDSISEARRHSERYVGLAFLGALRTVQGINAMAQAIEATD